MHAQFWDPGRWVLATSELQGLLEGDNRQEKTLVAALERSTLATSAAKDALIGRGESVAHATAALGRLYDDVLAAPGKLLIRVQARALGA